MDGADLVVCSLLDFCISLLFMVDISILLKFSGSLFFYFLIERCFADFYFWIQLWIQLTVSIQLKCLLFSDFLMLLQCLWFAHVSPMLVHNSWFSNAHELLMGLSILFIWMRWFRLLPISERACVAGEIIADRHSRHLCFLRSLIFLSCISFWPSFSAIQNMASRSYIPSNFRPTQRAAWKEYIDKMNPDDIPRPAPTPFDDSMFLVSDPDEAPPAIWSKFWFGSGDVSPSFSLVSHPVEA